MDTVSSSDLRANLAHAMKRVCDDHAPLVITRQGASPVVMLSLEDFRSLEETAYLTRSPANAARLVKAMADLETGKGKQRKLSR